MEKLKKYNMKVTFIGSGGWQGVPAPFGADKISRSIEWGSKDFRFRTSLHIETAHGRTILVELTPDIRLQSWRFNIKKPDAVVVSHWHWDHLFGLLELEFFAEKNKLLIYGNSIAKEWYDRAMAHVPVDFTVFNTYEPFVIDNIKVTPLRVDHVEDTDGFMFEDMDSEKKFVYLSDFYNIPEKTLDLIKGADVVTVDATYLDSSISDDDTHVQREDFATLFKKIDAKEVVLVNIGSYQGFTHNDFVKKYPMHTIAYDGMVRFLK